MTTLPFKPVTREKACEDLKVSMGTLDALIADGTLPRPVALGQRRLLYWHPDDFYGVLNRALRPAAVPPTNPEPTVSPLRSAPFDGKLDGNRDRAKPPAAPKGSASERAKSRQAARMAKLNT
jgi:predicted DNA-binding transcriptional regulator AlpA